MCLDFLQDVIRVKIIRLEKEIYSDFVDALVESFRRDYIPLGISKENARSNGSFFTINHLYSQINRGVDFYVIMDKDTPVGGLGLLEEDESYKIKKLFVAPSFQGLGLGKELMKFAEEKARENSKSRLKLGMILENKKLHDFYLSNGYTDKKLMYNKKMNLNIMFMEKSL